MLRSSFDYGRKRRTQCKFSAQRQGLCPCCAHRVCPIVPFRNASLTQWHDESVKVFSYFSRQCCAAALTMAENAARSASFLLNVKGSALALVGTHRVCPIVPFRNASLTQWHAEAVKVFLIFPVNAAQQL